MANSIPGLSAHAMVGGRRSKREGKMEKELGGQQH